MSDNHPTTYLKDYQKPPFAVQAIQLDFVIDDDVTTVSNTAQYMRESDGPLVLNGESELLTLSAIHLNGTPLNSEDYQLDAETLTLANLPDAFELTVVTTFDPKKNTKLSGLYLSGANYCTQCESHGFRRMTYFQDRPDVMTVFTTTITADGNRYPHMLANGNLVEDEILSTGKRKVTWHDPSLKPCYLFALVVGEFDLLADQFTTRSGREVDVHLYLEKGFLDQADFAMSSIKQSMAWDEKAFDREYDLDIFMVVAVSDFNYGAMENKGLNIFNTKYILASPMTATDADYIHVQGVIGHEYFHNWSGNRVTCRDWFQISLKEGLTVFRDQSFTMDMFSPGVKRIEDANIMRTMQFNQDSGPMAHPIRPDAYMEVSNFYTVTVYNKGAEVIRMIHTLLGEVAFKKAINLYFDRHDGEAVTTEDFVKAMEDSSGVDLSQFRLWYSQAGTPTLTITDHYDADKQTYVLDVKQSVPPTPGQPEKKAMHMPLKLGLLSESGQPLSVSLSDESDHKTEHICHIRSDEQQFTFSHVTSKPIPALLRGFSAPVKCVYDYDQAQLKTLLTYEQDPFVAWQAGQEWMTQSILSTYQDLLNGENAHATDALSEVFSQLLSRDDIDGYFCADLMTLPSMTYLCEQVSDIDVPTLYQAKSIWMKRIAEDVFDDFNDQYKKLVAGTVSYAPTFEQMASRRLANHCLAMMGYTERDEAMEACEQRYEKADNLTDKMGAIAALNHHESALRNQLLDQFYQDAKAFPLVLDRWFSLQASAPTSETLDQVNQLIQHEAFSISNPNRVRSVLGCFARNMPVLHHESGKGYAWLVAQTLKVDAINPQVAARIIEPMIHWRKFNTSTQDLMRQQLESMLKGQLSNDVFELVSKSLAE